MKKLFLIAFMFIIVPAGCSYEGVEDSNGRHVEKIPPININIENINTNNINSNDADNTTIVMNDNSSASASASANDNTTIDNSTDNRTSGWFFYFNDSI
tara:strand:- start:1666 stop:1962 length:297 start_codon:yes stop_codon:yes gene_type:complete